MEVKWLIVGVALKECLICMENCANWFISVFKMPVFGLSDLDFNFSCVYVQECDIHVVMFYYLNVAGSYIIYEPAAFK